jgi:hypothetical protein
MTERAFVLEKRRALRGIAGSEGETGPDAECARRNRKRGKGV